MEIEIKLYPPLDQGRFSRKRVTVDDPATALSMLEHLRIKQDEVESVFVNGKYCTFDQSLVDGDRLTLLPLIGGG